MSAKAVGFTEAQLQAFKDFYKSEYGEQTYMFVADEEGQIDSINLTHTDPWTMLRQPFTEATRSYNEGLITKEEYNEIIGDATVRFAKTAIRPFISETVANQAIANLISTLQTGDRINGGGFDKDTGGNEPLDRLPAALTNFFVDIGPNVITEIGQIKDILIDEEAGGYYAEPKDKEDFTFRRITTLPREPVQLLVDLKGKVTNYIYSANSLRQIPKASQSNSYEDLVEKYVEANTALVEEASKLYLKLRAVDTFYSETSESRKLAKSTLRKYTSKDSNILLISRGTAPQIDVSSETVWNQTKLLRAEGKVPNTATEFRPWFKKFKTDITLPYGETDLNKQEEDPADQIVLDPARVNKSEGGLNLYSRVSRFGEEQAAKQFGITSEVLKEYTQDTADLVNKLVDKGFFHERERAKPDKSGNLSGGDIFNAANHLRTAVLAKDSQSLRNLAQLKELAQFVAGDRGPHGALGDSKNNLLGFKFYDRAKGNREKFETLVEQNLIDRFSERLSKDKGGEVEVPNASPEPDERIDKMTGLPYNLQAGIPFRDEEDPLKRLGLVGGGKATDPMQRLGFAAGSKVIKTAVEGGAELSSKAEEVLEVGSRQVTKAFKYLMDSTGVDKAAKQLASQTPDGSVDDVAKSLQQAPVKNINKKMSTDQYIKEKAAIDKTETPDEWKAAVKQLVKDTREVEPVVRTPELEKSAQAFKADLITRGEHLENIDLYKPVTPFTRLTVEPSDKALVFSLHSDQMEKGFFVLDSKITDKFNVTQSPLSIGDFFKGRLDINAYNIYDTWIVAGTTKGVKGTHYAKAMHYIGEEGKPVTFTVSENPAEKILTGEKNKTTIAFIKGFIKDLDPIAIRKKANELLKNPEWTQIGFDPRRQTNFYIREGDMINTPVREADEVIQIGPLVLAKNVVLDMAYKGLAVGGLV
jgi:hypothetical protein